MAEHFANIPKTVVARAADAGTLARGVVRLLGDLGYRTLVEFPLANGRRVDVVGLDRHGAIAVIEIKSSLVDLRRDDKWTEYLPFCDLFYFAVGPDFPLPALPAATGIIVADAYAGVVVREAPRQPLVATRRKAVTLRFARTAAGRLDRMLDPRL